MAKEELEEHRKFFEDIRNNRSEEENRIIEQKLREDEEVRKYHRRGKIHPKDIETAKDILESQHLSGFRSDFSDETMNDLVEWAKYVLKKQAIYEYD